MSFFIDTSLAFEKAWECIPAVFQNVNPATLIELVLNIVQISMR